MATVLVEDQVEIPGNVATLTAFRHWALSESFPKRGRIDWVGSQVEVDMSPEDLFTHGTLKTEIVRVLGAMAKNKGYNLVPGETRISSVAGNVSAEPDVVAVSDAAIDTDRVRLTPKAGGEAGRRDGGQEGGEEGERGDTTRRHGRGSRKGDERQVRPLHGYARRPAPETSRWVPVAEDFSPARGHFRRAVPRHQCRSGPGGRGAGSTSQIATAPRA